jgi:NIMA (never in mitosis gene a)-related kinase 1/4/5
MGLDEYVVGKEAGRGKFSTVFRAKRKADATTIALKKIHIDVMSQEDLDACLREVNMLKDVCDHPNIISYLDSFLEDDALYIVLEWAHAGDLKRQIRKAKEKRARFDEVLIWKIFSQVADALRHMHSKRTMHRDLKPANIFLSSDGTVKVGDLGLGRFLSEQTLEAFTRVGTPLYMSPELLASSPSKKVLGYGFASDVYSLGCILYELVKLRAPFKEKGMTFTALCERVIRGDYEPLPDCFTDDLRDLVDQMLSTDPDSRPSLDEIVRISQEMRSRLIDLAGSKKKKEQHGNSESKSDDNGKEQSSSSSTRSSRKK